MSPAFFNFLLTPPARVLPYPILHRSRLPIALEEPVAAPALSDATALLARNQNSGLRPLFATLSENERRHWPIVSFNRFKAVGRGVRAFAHAPYQPEKSSIE